MAKPTSPSTGRAAHVVGNLAQASPGQQNDTQGSSSWTAELEQPAAPAPGVPLTPGPGAGSAPGPQRPGNHKGG